MVNRGIGETFSSMIHNIDDAGTINLNISYEDYNLYLNVPLFSIKSQKTFSTSLIYYQQGTHSALNEMFPHFLRLSFYKTFEIDPNDESIIYVTNADGMTDTYNKSSDDFYYCSKNYAKLELIDCDSKIKYFLSNDSYYIYGIDENYPESYVSKDSSTASFTASIYNHKILSISIEKSNDDNKYTVDFVNSLNTEYVQHIIITKHLTNNGISNSQVIERIYYNNEINYDHLYFCHGNSQCSDYYRYTKMVFSPSSNILYSLTDGVTNLRAEYHLYSNHCDWFRIAHINNTHIDEMRNIIESISGIAKVNFYDGTSSIMYLNSSRLPIFTINQEGIATVYQFDKYRHLVYQSQPICLNKAANLNSLLLNNLFNNGNANWNAGVAASFGTYNFPYSDIVGTTGLKINGTNGKLFQTIDVKGLPGEAYTFNTLIAGLSQVHVTNPIKITIDLIDSDNNIVSTNSVTSCSNSSAFQKCELLSVSALSYQAFSKVRVYLIDKAATSDWIVNQAWLIKAYPSTALTYGDKGNLFSSYQKANETRCLYDADVRCLASGSFQGSQYFNEYEPNSKIWHKSYGDFSLKQTKNLNTHNLITEAFISTNDTYQNTTCQYNDFQQLIYQSDGTLGQSFTYNDFDEISTISNTFNAAQIQYQHQSTGAKLINLSKFTDGVLVDQYSFDYSDFKTSSTTNNDLIEYVPTYDSIDDITTMSSVYDNVNYNLFHYVYADTATKNLISKSYGNSGYYSFSYDSLNRLIDITSQFDNIPNTTCSLSYDAFSRLHTAGEYTYTYDDEGNLINLGILNFNIFSNLNNGLSVDKKYQYSSQNSYHLYQESKGHSLYLSRQTNAASFQLHDGLISTIAYPHHLNSTIIQSLTMYGTKGISYEPKSVNNGTIDSYTIYGALHYDSYGSSAAPEYNIWICYPQANNRGDDYGLWFKIDETASPSDGAPLLTIDYNSDGIGLDRKIMVYLSSNTLFVFYSYQQDQEVLLFQKTITPAPYNWNFLTLSVIADDEYGYIQEVKLGINNEFSYFDFDTHPDLEKMPIAFSTYMLRKVSYFGSPSRHQFGYATGFFANTSGLFFKSEDLSEIFYSSSALIYGITYLLKDNTYSSFSSSHFISQSENCLNINGTKDVIPLINSFKTNNGNVPIKAEQNYFLNYFSDCSFLFNETTHKYSYFAQGKPLSYVYNFSGSGSVSLNLTLPVLNYKEKRHILTIGNNLMIYFNNNGYLCYKINSTECILSSTIISANQKHHFTISWMQNIVVDSVQTNYTRFTIRLDNNTYAFIYQTAISWLTNPKISLGIRGSDNCFPLEGFIDSVVVSDAELNSTQISQIRDDFNAVDIVNRYHSYNRLGGRFTFNNDGRVIEQTYSYIIDETSHPYHIDANVRKEYLVYNDDGHEAEIETIYSYDGLHRLTGISPFDGGISNNIQYTYDSLNRLTRSHQSNGDDFTYAYDSTHNILSVINNHSSTTVHSMTYSMNRMMSFDNYALTYDPNYIFNPYQYGSFDSNNVLTDGLTFTFMGKRLVNATKTGTFDIPSMSFSYDFSDKRLSKTVNGVIHQYYYDSDNLVYETETEVSSSILLHEKKFFYDENGILTFMELDGVRYFYYIDATHMVRGLFNSDGELIVRYSYDAWGNVTNIIDYSSISLSTLNPFLFKCYYYDHESKWYYCLSRYYVPLWMRWLSIDDSSYLTSEIPAGYNLYFYCNNNPAMYKQRPALRDSYSLGASSISEGFNFFGAELRSSLGWNNSPTIATGWFGRFGISSYNTMTKGQSGMLYAYAGSTKDVANLLGTNYYAGFGINLFDIIRVEVQLETFGIGAQINIGRFSISASINLTGTISLTFGWMTDNGNGTSNLTGLTMGINTGFLFAVIAFVYKLVTTGDTSPLPGLTY